MEIIISIKYQHAIPITDGRTNNDCCMHQSQVAACVGLAVLCGRAILTVHQIIQYSTVTDILPVSLTVTVRKRREVSVSLVSAWGIMR